jgi:hypothetical protein
MFKQNGVPRDLRASNARIRRGLNVGLEELDRALYERVLTDPCDYHAKYCIDMDLAALGQRLREKKLEDIDEILQMVRDGCTWKEIGKKMSRDPNVTQRRFRRWATQLFGLDG